MKTIIVDLPSEFPVLKIVPFADWHKDDPRCNEAFIDAEIAAVERDEFTYWLGNGDLLNFALKNSKSNIYLSKMNPTEQVDWLCNKLYPIRKKALGFAVGNHEDRAFKESGIDVGKFITKQLGIQDKYYETGGLIFVSFGQSYREKSRGRKMTYSIYTKHGSGGGKKEGGKINSLISFANTVDADLYIGSHTHLPFQTSLGFHRVNLTNRSIKYTPKFFVNTGAALDFGGYAEQGGYTPAALAHILVTLDGTKRKMTAEMTIE